ncbi:MAG: hypothetical protein KAY24_15895 [Candidatus Eisenbacteria sp.]|nr:hypothetical protein [Candidatus Eisenbacteria bacterium]
MKVYQGSLCRNRQGPCSCPVLWKRMAGISVLILAVIAIGCSNDCICNCGSDSGDGNGNGNGDDTSTVIRHVEDFLPQDAGGFTRDGDPSIATTASELQDIINGGYEIYDNHNFQEFVEQKYKGPLDGGEKTLTVWIFELATVEDAQELYDDPEIDIGNCEELGGIGDQERLCRGLNSLLIQVQRDQYWIKLSIDSSSQDARTLLELFGTHIDLEIRS